MSKTNRKKTNLSLYTGLMRVTCWQCISPRHSAKATQILA